MSSSESSASLHCPHCQGEDVEITQPGWFSNLLFYISILFVMSQIKRGDLYTCRSCGKTFRQQP